jgi:serine/threonine protein kinase
VSRHGPGAWRKLAGMDVVSASGIESPPGSSRLTFTGTPGPLLREIARAEAMLPPDDLVGTTIALYHVEGELGRGGMGVVYRARHQRLGREVALKVLPASVAADRGRRMRLLREARSAASVDHPSIAAVFEVGESHGRLYLAMELVHGTTLRERLSAGALPTRQVIRVAEGIAAGLGRAHDKGIVHRDLKPENVMLTPQDTVKILDFGLAKLLEVNAVGGDDESYEQLVTQQGQLLGTPAYMAPEQARGDEVDARSDVFSFGVMLYEMLAGARPFRGRTALAVLLAAITAEPEPLAGRSPGVTPALEAVVLRCLAKRPADRYANGREVAEALGAARNEDHRP